MISPIVASILPIAVIVAGEWNQQLAVDREVVWTGTDTQVPQSTCSQPCTKDQIKQVRLAGLTSPPISYLIYTL